jgi:ubiquitin-protein ligase/predicted transposase YbfD/YdcC
MNSFVLFDKHFQEAGGFRHSLAHLIGSVKSFEARKERFEKDLESLKQLKQSALSNLFICYDVHRWDLIKVLVSGPMESDYADGLFLFEVSCPPDYPNTAPQVRLVTTGRFTVSFHPDLLRTGDVLGLAWTPSMNLKNFLLQIRDIFQKPNWNPANRLFSYIVRYNTMKYAILDMIRYPPQDFKDVVKAHFQIKNNDIILLTGKWMEEVDTIPSYDEALESNPETVDLFRDSELYSVFESVYSELIELNEDAVNDDGSFESEKEANPKNPESAEEEHQSEEHKNNWGMDSDEETR